MSRDTTGFQDRLFAVSKKLQRLRPNYRWPWILRSCRRGVWRPV